MSNENRHIDLIEKYLNGELSGDELAAFERRLETDAEFAAEVEMHKALVAGVKQAREQELRNFISQNAKVRRINPAYSRFMVAAAALIVFGVGIYISVSRLLNNVTQENVAEQRRDKSERQSKVSENSTNSDSVEMAAAEEQKDKPAVEEKPIPPEISIVEDDEPTDEDAYGLDDIERMPATEFDLDVADSIEVEDFTFNDANSNRFNNAPPPPAPDKTDKEEEIVIAKDQKVFDTTVVMHSFTIVDSNISPDLNFTHDLSSGAYTSAPSYSYVSPGAYKVNIDTTSMKVISGTTINLEGTSDKKVKTEKETKSEEEVKTIPVNIQFWRSPVNYKGYSFDGKKLVLYGIDKQTKVYVYKLGDKWYMKMGEYYYVISPDGQFHMYKKVTDPDIIKLLGK